MNNIQTYHNVVYRRGFAPARPIGSITVYQDQGVILVGPKQDRLDKLYPEFKDREVVLNRHNTNTICIEVGAPLNKGERK